MVLIFISRYVYQISFQYNVWVCHDELRCGGKKEDDTGFCYSMDCLFFLTPYQLDSTLALEIVKLCLANTLKQFCALWCFLKDNVQGWIVLLLVVLSGFSMCFYCFRGIFHFLTNCKTMICYSSNLCRADALEKPPLIYSVFGPTQIQMRV